MCEFASSFFLMKKTTFNFFLELLIMFNHHS